MNGKRLYRNSRRAYGRGRSAAWKDKAGKAVLTKEPDGRRITVEIRMAEQFKKFFDWWDVFAPEVTLVEQNVCIFPSFKVFHLKNWITTTAYRPKFLQPQDI